MVAGKAVAGITGGTAGKDITLASRCATDIFSVTSPNGIAPPSICGTNTGDHMYVDASQACNDLNFLLGNMASGTTLASRSWSIRVTQLECGSSNLAPSGCTQYYYGSSTGLLKSYNFDGGYHLANQRQNICIRREKGNCRICYTTTGTEGYKTDFEVSGAGGMTNKFVTKSCCGYKADGMGTDRDCVIVPSVSLETTGKLLGLDNFCGQGGFGSKSTALDMTKAKTLCSK